MGQVRHGSDTTTHAIRAAIQRSLVFLATLSREFGINPKTVAEWRKRQPLEDRKTRPKKPRSTTLNEAEEAILVAFRRHTLLALNDCLYALQPLIPHLTRSALSRCLQRHGISRLPDAEGDKPKRQRFKRYPTDFFHIHIAEVQTGEGKLYLLLAIDRTSKFAVTELVDPADSLGVPGTPAASCAVSDPQDPDQVRRVRIDPVNRFPEEPDPVRRAAVQPQHGLGRGRCVST